MCGDTRKGEFMNGIKYPKNELIWFHYFNRNHIFMFLSTSNLSREWYYLYELIDGKLVKLGKGKSPTELEERFDVDNRLKT